MASLDEKALHPSLMEIMDQLLLTYQELGAAEVVAHLRKAKQTAQERIDNAPPGPLFVPMRP